MVLVISLVATALTTLLMLLTKSGGSDFGPQVHEQNKSIRSSFHYYANKVQMNNQNEMLYFQVPTEIVLPVPTEVEDKEVVQLPVSREMVLPVQTEVEDKEVVQDMKKMKMKMKRGMSTRKEEDVA